MATNTTAFFLASVSVVTRITLINALIPKIFFTSYNDKWNKMKHLKFHEIYIANLTIDLIFTFTFVPNLLKINTALVPSLMTVN